MNNTDSNICKINKTKKEIALLRKQKLEEYARLLDEEINKVISEEYEKVE